MTSIINNLGDPSWWFSTVLIAIIASIVAGFLKDQISYIIGRTFNKLKDWSQKKKKTEEELIEALSNNPNYLLIGLGIVIFMTIMFIGTMILYLLFPMRDALHPINIDSGLSNLIKLISSIAIYPFFGGLSMYFGYKSTSSLSLIGKATKRYRIKNGLPKLL